MDGTVRSQANPGCTWDTVVIMGRTWREEWGGTPSWMEVNTSQMLFHIINAISWFSYRVSIVIILSSSSCIYFCYSTIHIIIICSEARVPSSYYNNEMVLRFRKVLMVFVSLYSISNKSIRGVHKQPLEPITLTYDPTTLLRLKWSIKLCFFVSLYLPKLCLLYLYNKPH